MDNIDEIVSRLEDTLNVKLKKLEKGSEMNGNSYFISNARSPDGSIRYEKLHELCLSNIHFEDFSALEPVFETLRYLKLIECSVADGWKLHQIKELDRLTLENCSISVDSEINRKSDFYLSSLHLSEISSNGLKALTSVFYSVYSLSISHSTLENIYTFLHFDYLLIKIVFLYRHH